MAESGTVPATPQFTQQDLNDAYSSLLFDLNQAYWAAIDVNTKDQLFSYVEAVTNIISQLNATDLASRDAAYTALVQQMTTVNNQLTTLQKQINSLINRISTAATIISDIAKVLTVAAQVISKV